MSRRIVATIPDELAERLDAHLAGQEVDLTISALVNGALRKFLGRSQTHRPPDWTPICPKCGWGARWLAVSSKLVAACGVCGHWSEGMYPDQEHHEFIADHWRGLGAPANEKPLPDQERAAELLEKHLGRTSEHLILDLGLEVSGVRWVEPDSPFIQSHPGPDLRLCVVYRDPTWQDPRPAPEAPDGQGGTE